MLVTDLDDFIEKVRIYPHKSRLEDCYQQALKRRDVWDRLEEIDTSKTEDVVLKFLNQWKCRIDRACASGLAETLRESSERLSRFKKHRFEQIGLDSLIGDFDIIEEAFKRIASVQAGRKKVGATATSKILHLVNPSFFVMSDRKIRQGYGCSDNELGYANLMLRIKLFADSLLREYSAVRNIPMNSAFQSLASECESAATTLPKLLDEYNWVKSGPK